MCYVIFVKKDDSVTDIDCTNYGHIFTPCWPSADLHRVRYCEDLNYACVQKHSYYLMFCKGEKNLVNVVQ